MSTSRSSGWYSRGYLPHLDFREATQGVTFRLADALPKSVIECMKQDLEKLDGLTEEKRRRIAELEDAGHGECVLNHQENAKIVEDALLHFDGDRYELLEWVVMPNHVHVLVKPHSDTLDRIVKSWKSYSSRFINKRLGRSGKLWFREYFDRYIRDERHWIRARNYVRNNPVKAGLCSAPEDWEFGSASWERRFGAGRGS